MIRFLLIVVNVLFSITLFAQFDYDNIGRNEYYIVKSGANNKRSVKKTNEIKNSKDVEQNFGSDFKLIKRYSETEDIYYNDFVFENGLTLQVPEYQRMNNGFRITSDKYILKLKGEQLIKLGMNLDEFETIFPKSYKKQVIDENKEWFSLIVLFSFVRNNELIVEDSCVVFCFSKKDGLLLEMYTNNPS